MKVDKVAVVEREAFRMKVEDTPTLAVKDVQMKDAKVSTLLSSTTIEDVMKDEAKKKAIEDKVDGYFANSI